jgi:hypothetical protein
VIESQGEFHFKDERGHEIGMYVGIEPVMIAKNTLRVGWPYNENAVGSKIITLNNSALKIFTTTTHSITLSSGALTTIASTPMTFAAAKSCH